MKTITELQKLFDGSIPYSSFNRQPNELYEPFRYILKLGGKRMRPVLVLLGCEMFGGKAKKALPQAIAIELFHNFTLIHDDIMDKAPLRRGLPTVHEKFNSNIAILSGDVMLVYAYEQLIQCSRELVKSVVTLFNQTAIKVCEGQQWDMNFENRNDVSAKEYLQMIELKTAVLLGCSLQIGAIIGNASDREAERIYNIGKHLGIAFQLQDDILDSFGETKKFGKQTGGDIIQNKKTLLLIEALNRASGKIKTQLNEWLSRKDFNNVEKVEAVLSIYKQLDIRSVAEKEMQTHYELAMNELDEIKIPEKRKTELRAFAGKLLVREK